MRRLWRKTLVSMVGCCLPAAALAQSFEGGNPAGGERQASRRLDVQLPIAINYLVYLPPDYEHQPTWPLVLFLHGSGERGNDLELVKTHGIPKLIAAGQDFPFLVVSPQCPDGQRWQVIELIALLDDVISRYKVDRQRVYITGYSMGGFGTWALAAQQPNRFAAIAPICGGGERYWVGDLTKMPIWTFHGDQDDVVPLRRTQELVTHLESLGSAPKFTIYKGVGHDSWTPTYENPELYSWLLKQKRR